MAKTAYYENAPAPYCKDTTHVANRTVHDWFVISVRFTVSTAHARSEQFTD